MKKVLFTYNTGRQREIGERDAILLQKLNQGTYLTRDMRPQQAPAPVVVVPQDEYDAMSLDELRELAEERGVEVHHRAGAEKIRAALREAGK